MGFDYEKAFKEMITTSKNKDEYISYLRSQHKKLETEIETLKEAYKNMEAELLAYKSKYESR